MLQWAVQRAANPARVSESLKAVLSSDWSLQLDSMKPESLVIANQQSRGEYVLGGLYTPPVTSRKSVTPEVSGPTMYLEGAAEGGIGDWDEVVTR